MFRYNLTMELLLSEPTWNDEGDSEIENNGIDVLKKLESIIWSVVTSEGRSEARLWLCKTISCLSDVTPQVQCDVFMKLLRSRPRKISLAEQVIRMMFEKRLRKLAGIVAKRTYVLEDFFKGNPRRISQWFGHFASSGESDHKLGARALAQFAFVNRDICWEELEWRGKHGQSPAVVATKPHYFLDLDVQRTVENFLEYVPDFWSSNELAESVKDGELLLMDAKFFIDYFVDLMYEKDSEEVWEVVRDLILQEPFSSLCHRLLIILEEGDLCNFLNSLGKFHNPKIGPKCVGQTSYWLELLLYMHRGCAPLDELLLVNAIVNQGRQLLRLLRDEEHEEQRRKIEELVSEISITSVVKGCLKMKGAESVKWLGLQSWVIQYRLSEECKTADSWEAIFIKSGIGFRKSGEHDLLYTDKLLEESEDESSVRARRKKGKSGKKRKRYYGLDDCDMDEVVDVDTLCVWQSLQHGTRSWLLSTDNYCSSWNIVDLPEYMAKHCFSTWMNWLSSRFH
ncbi:hypothetical protein ACHQM5_028477 [Ranunculus cassubicifolius]